MLLREAGRTRQVAALEPGLGSKPQVGSEAVWDWYHPKQNSPLWFPFREPLGSFQRPDSVIPAEHQQAFQVGAKETKKDRCHFRGAPILTHT